MEDRHIFRHNEEGDSYNPGLPPDNRASSGNDPSGHVRSPHEKALAVTILGTLFSNLDLDSILIAIFSRILMIRNVEFVLFNTGIWILVYKINVPFFIRTHSSYFSSFSAKLLTGDTY